MAGVKGAGGPPPKRSDQRRRSNTPAAGEPRQAPAGAPFEVPEADPEWHPIAYRWFESLKSSGQSAFYVESDWLTAFTIAESMSREFKPQPMVIGKGENAETRMVELPPKAGSLMAWLKGASTLLATEGDRRRAGLELVHAGDGDEEVGDVPHLDDARTRLRGAG